MIARMKKISVLLYHRDRDRFLLGLQSLGVVHIVERAEKDASDAASTLDAIKRHEAFVAAYPAGPAPQNPPPAPAEEILDRFESLRAEEARLRAEVAALVKDREIYGQYGQFDPAVVRALTAAGVGVGLFTTTSRRFATLDRSALNLEIVTQTPRDIAFLLVWRGERPALDAEEIRIPELGPRQIDEKEQELNARLGRIESELRALGARRGQVAARLTELRDLARFYAARSDCASYGEGRLLALHGWFPARSSRDITAWLAGQDVWFETAEPDAADDVPVKLENGPFSRLLEPITRLYMLPGYRELDPTPFFAPAFAFFVGLCLGDVAYGAILFLLGMVARTTAPRQYRSVASLVAILGCMVMGCGMALNSFFGMAIFGGPGISGALLPTGAQYFAPLSPYEGADGTVYPAMSFALVVGFLQMLFAMVLQMVNRLRQGKALTVMIPLSWMMMFVGIVVWEAHTDWYALGVNRLQIGRLAVGSLLTAVPEVVGSAVCLGGVALMFLSGMINGSGNVLVRPLTFLWDFYNFATGNVGYLISYIRLFALGLTGGLLGATFNGLAVGFITHDGVVNWLSPMVVFTVLLLVAGHALNFALCVVGAFVHPLRLTFVEFYQTLQFAGGGRDFRPFARVKE